MTRTLARELAAAPTAAVYGRIGSCTVPHGTLASWLVDVLNILTGNLDRPGGALFPQAATDRTPRPAGPGHGFALGRWHSRVSRHPEAKGELPLSALAEEIDTATAEGEPVRALIAVAANPVLSAPDGDRLDKALGSLDFMVSVDPYLNETSRHAHVVLPPPPPSQSPHHDFAFNTLAVRNQVRYTRPAVPLEPGRMAETEIFARLILAATGMHGAAPSAVDDLVIGQTLGKAVKEPHSPVHGRDPRDLTTELGGDTGPERRLDMMLRLGPYGDGFGVRPDGLSLTKLLAHLHGIDLGPLGSRLPQPLKTRSGRVELLPQPIADDLPRLREALRHRADGTVLIGHAAPPLQQQLDAQRPRAHRRHQPLHPAHPSRGRRAARPDGRRPGADQGRRGRGGHRGGTHRRRTPRRGQPAARLGSRPSREPASATPPRTPASTSTSSSTAACSTRSRATRSSTAYPWNLPPSWPCEQCKAVTSSFALIARTSTSC